MNNKNISLIKINRYSREWKIIDIINNDNVKIVMGQSPPSSTYNLKGKGLPFLQGKAEFGDMFPRPVLFCTKPLKTTSSNSILMSVRAPVGDVNIAPYEVCIGRGLMAIEANKEKLNYYFIYYYLSFIKKYIESLSSGSTFKAITKNDLAKIKIPLPGIKEQEKIADILLGIDKNIAEVKKAIKRAESLKKGLMQKLLMEGIGHKEFKDTEIGRIPKEWNIDELDNITDVRDGTHDSPRYVSKGIPFITSKNLKTYLIDFRNCNFISNSDHLKIQKRSKIDSGDILFGMIGTIGNPVIIIKEFEFSVKNVAIIKFVNQYVTNKFILYLLDSEIIKKQFKFKSSGGIQKFISLYNIRHLKVPIPKLSEQEKIADIILTADQRIELLQKKKDKLERIKIALMNILLTGRKRVK